MNKKSAKKKQPSGAPRRAAKPRPQAAGVMRSVNPCTEETMHELPLMSRSEVTAIVAKTRQAFSRWKGVPVAERAALLKELAGTLRREKRNYGTLITQEMGKPVGDALAEVEKCAWLAEYFSENGPKFLEPEIIATEARKSYIVFDPLGIVLAIEPWNFPFWQVFRAAVPALIAGNAVLLKHASNVPMTALAIEDCFQKAGFPKDLFRTLLISSRDALKLIDDDLVDAVSLTGSNAAGEEVGARAGRKIKSLVLELGGSDPCIVLDDADAVKAGKTAAQARMINSGQSCIASKRFIVMEKVADEFTRHFVDRLKELKIGDPLDETTDIGPLARKDILAGLKIQLKDAKAKGAKVIELSHDRNKGWFMAPVVVLNPTADMKVLSEEVFGPIAPIVVVKDEDEAVRIANDTEYGLGASIWSKDIGRAERLARRIEAGCIAINDFVKSDPRLPFGGVKKSGVGRELSHYGLKELVNIKTIVVRE